MLAFRGAPRARSLLPAVAVALLALPAATAQAWPGLNGYMVYGSNRTGSQFSDDIYVSPLDAETPTQLTFRRADDGQPAWSPDGRGSRSRPRSSAATSSRSSTPTARARRC